MSRAAMSLFRPGDRLTTSRVAVKQVLHRRGRDRRNVGGLGVQAGPGWCGHGEQLRCTGRHGQCYQGRCNSVQRQHEIHAAGGDGTGRHTGGPGGHRVLGEHAAAVAFDGANACGAVSQHAGQHDADYGGSQRRGGAAEQRVTAMETIIVDDAELARLVDGRSGTARDHRYARRIDL